jgi:hypothetical protein
MKAFYKKLHDTFALQSIKDRYSYAGVPEVQSIDLYAGQDFSPEWFEARLFPAVLVSWSIDYNNEPATATITFRLCYEQLRDLSNIGASKEEGLKFLDFIKITDDVIKSIETETTGKPSLVLEEQEVNETIVDVFILTYTCSYTGKYKDPKRPSVAGNIDDLLAQKNLLKSRL